MYIRLIWVDTLRRGHTVGFLAGRLTFGKMFSKSSAADKLYVDKG